jgi:hypothetical protein
MSKRLRAAWAKAFGGVILAASLAACAGPPPPTYNTDAFKGIYNQNAASVPADVPVTVQHPVGVILSDNFEIWFKALKEANEYWGARVPASLTNTAVIADFDPTFLAGRVLQNLKAHFPEAQEIKDFQTAVASGKKAVVLVDIAPEIGQRTPTTNKLDITYYFFDARMNPVSKLIGHGEHYVPFASMTGYFQDIVDQALAQLDQKMRAAMR